MTHQTTRHLYVGQRPAPRLTWPERLLVAGCIALSSALTGALLVALVLGLRDLVRIVTGG